MDTERALHELRSFLDGEGRLLAMPAKHKKKLAALYYLAGKIEQGRRYTESELNDLLDDWALFRDPATVRRELFNRRLLERTRDCACYWRGDDLPAFDAFFARYC